MRTNGLANTPKPEVIALLWIALEALAEDQLKQPMAWVDFLAALQWFCTIRGWVLEYNYISDYSCAIFAQEAQERTSRSDDETEA